MEIFYYERSFSHRIIVNTVSMAVQRNDNKKNKTSLLQKKIS